MGFLSYNEKKDKIQILAEKRSNYIFENWLINKWARAINELFLQPNKEQTFY